MNKFKDEIISFGDRISTPEDAKCLFSLYKTMADENAFLEDDSTSQSRFIRLWTVGSFGALFIKKHTYISQFDFFDFRKPGTFAIRDWFNKLGQKVYDDAVSTRNTNLASGTYEPTNMQISRSLALLTSAIISNNQTYLGESKKIYKEALENVSFNSAYSTDKGYLLPELRRGRRAQAYHATSLSTLLAIRSLARATGCSFTYYHLGQDVTIYRLAFLFRKTAEGGFYRDALRQPRFRDNTIFPGKLLELSENQVLELEPEEYLSEQSAIQNVDGLTALLPETSTGSHDFKIKEIINEYLRAKRLAPLQSNQPLDGDSIFKLGGDLHTYPRFNSIRSQSDLILNNGSTTDDFRALLQPGFCN